jgi:large repetitive protein
MKLRKLTTNFNSILNFIYFMNHLKTLNRIVVVALMFVFGMTNKLSAQTACPASNEIEITVNPVLTLTGGLTADVTVRQCVGGTATLTATASAGSGGTLNFAWQQDAGTGFVPYTASAPVNTVTGTGAARTTTSVITPPTTTAGASVRYRVIITDPATAASNCGSATSGIATVEVNADLSFGTDLTASTQEQCIGGTQTLNVVVTGGSNNPSSLTYIWEESDSNSPYDWHPAPSAAAAPGSASYTTVAQTSANTKYYRVRVTDTGNGCNEPPASVIKPVKTNADLAFTTDVNTITECIGGTDQFAVVVTGGSGGTKTYTWEESDGNAPYAWHPAPSANATLPTYTPPSTTAGTKYYQVTVSEGGAGCGALTSTTPAAVTINAKPTVALSTVANETAVCENGTITFNANITNPGVGCTLEWLKKAPTDPGFTPVTTQPAAPGTTYTTPALSTGATGTKYKVRFVCAGSGCCTE